MVPGKPLTPREKRFITLATRLAIHTPITAIAKRIGRSSPVVGNFIREQRLRSRKQNLEITKQAIRKRHFPAHEKKPQIIALLWETKRKQNMTINKIALTCRVSPNFVERVAVDEGILSKEEIREISKAIRAKKKKTRRFIPLEEEYPL